MYAIGLMTGTSLDGLDVALCDIKGSFLDTKVKLIDFICLDIKDELRNKIKNACSEEKSNNKLICSLDFELGYFYLEGVKKIIKKNNLKYSDIAFVASHGQTIYHLPYPKEGFYSSTLQIGQASIISYNTGIKTISNFRVMDIAAGGQGAPLVPYADYILYSSKTKNIALQNIGGISNVTYLKSNGTLEDIFAFDNGPGNMIINEAMKSLYNLEYDNKGEIALKGKLIDKLLNELLKHPYLEKIPPKSTGREEFGKQYVDLLLEKYKNEKSEDIIHTFTLFTAICIRDSYMKFFTKMPDKVIISGGGAFNDTLMNMLKTLLGKCEVCTQEELGYFSDAKEAIAFVILGNETLHNRPSNVPSATGSKKRVILGTIC
ncbi:anhydro-N-acetylmuramic acid kinase AnmK [Caviibacter abscessus]|uniref:anhydro-N-acetylmuramic acid kinase AnmK n=1 Tax=Caviibacter abscessus TaxID=1766719 RepID=UPI0008385BDC|nr:anhydro-N-acetylmuramic acid kinase AnmK [Caviibacter abscessus]